MVRGRRNLTPHDIKSMEIISSNLKSLLNSKKMKQINLADDLDIPRSTINDYVRGTSLPNAGNIQKIADYFDVKKSDIDPRFKNSEPNMYEPRYTNRLQEAMDKKGLNRYDLFIKTIPYQNSLGIEIKENDLLEYIAGSKPSDEKIYLLSKALDISEAWLLGYDVDMNRISDKERGNIDFLDILIIYNQLEEERKQKVVSFARDELKEQKKEE